MKISVSLAVHCTILCCTMLTSCISEELLTEKYNTNSSFYNNAIGPFKSIVFLCREEGLDLNRLKKFESSLTAKCAKHGTRIYFLHYKTEDNQFQEKLDQFYTLNNIDFTVKIVHSGQFLHKKIPDRFAAMRQKSPFRVESLSFSTMGYYPENNSRPLWKGSFSVANESVVVADEQAVTVLYKRMLRDGLLK
jgi:hypothetical protein